MEADINKASVDYLEATQAGERRMRNIFLGSIFLSMLVVFHLIFLSRADWSLSRIVCVSFPPILLWSLAVTGYAFHALWVVGKEKARLIERAALSDPTTGVKSPEYIRRLLQKEYERSMETGQPTAVLYVDLEQLDLVNNKFGHSVGDIVLKGLAMAIVRSTPQGSIVGRIGGDEFIVILPGMKANKAKLAALAITQAVKEYELDLGNRGNVDFLGCRIGVIACPQTGGLADEIISVAQHAAYESAGETRAAAATRVLRGPGSATRDTRT